MHFLVCSPPSIDPSVGVTASWLWVNWVHHNKSLDHIELLLGWCGCLEYDALNIWHVVTRGVGLEVKHHNESEEDVKGGPEVSYQACLDNN